LAQVGYFGGAIAPTTVAAALSVAPFSGVTAVNSSMFDNIELEEIRVVSSDFYVVESSARDSKCHSSISDRWW
jgi:hypothetical protein